MAGFFDNILGTVSSLFRIGGPTSGVNLKNVTNNLAVRNAADSADAAITASQVNVSGDTIVLNSDATEAAADWKYTLTRPSSGMTADVTLTLPVDDGTANQVLQTDGSGNLSWASAASTSACTTRDTTTLNFGDTSPIAMVTLPANAVVERVSVIIDTTFDGTPTISVGKSGSTSKYLGSTDVDLTLAAGTRFDIRSSNAASGSTEAVIITYSAGSATVGSARIIIDYSVPA